MALEASGSGALVWMAGGAKPDVRRILGGAPAAYNEPRNWPDAAPNAEAVDAIMTGGGPAFAYRGGSCCSYRLKLVADLDRAPVDLSPDPVAREPKLATSGGAIAAVWKTAIDRNDHLIGRVGLRETPRTISTPGASVARPTLVATQDGTLVATWLQDDDDVLEDPSDYGGDHAVYAAVRPAGAGAFGAPQKLSETVESPNDIDGPVAATAGEETLVGWAIDKGEYFRLEVSARPPGGAFDELPEQISSGLLTEDGTLTEGDARDPALAAQGTRAVATWTQATRDLEAEDRYWRIAGARYDVGDPDPEPEPPPDDSGDGELPDAGEPPPTVIQDPAPPPPPPPPSSSTSRPAPDTTRPVVSRLQASRERFAVGKKLGKVVAKAREKTLLAPGGGRTSLRVGSKFAFLSSEAGRYTLKLTPVTCVRRNGRNGHKLGKCEGSRRRGVEHRGRAVAGRNIVTVLGKGMRPGIYSASVRVRDPAGNASSRKTMTVAVDDAAD